MRGSLAYWLVVLVFILVSLGYAAQIKKDNDVKVIPDIDQYFNINEKLLLLRDRFDITLTISASAENLQKNVIVGTLYDRLNSPYDSPFDGNILAFEDVFEILSITNGWEREKVTKESDYEIVKYMVDKSSYANILKEGWLFINKHSAIKNKTLTLSLKAKQKGRFGLVMSQMNAKTGFVNLCVGDSPEEAKELCNTNDEWRSFGGVGPSWFRKEINANLVFGFTELPELNKEVSLVMKVMPEEDIDNARLSILLHEKGVKFLRAVSVTRPTKKSEWTDTSGLDMLSNNNQISWQGNLKKSETFIINIIVKTIARGRGSIHAQLSTDDGYRGKVKSIHIDVNKYRAIIK